ncbi:MAG TPA: diacylglycerol kinase family protein [Thermoleophilaceae bacterium]|nr:diacylglycerol kinase family protein [Thermoleophilaceae bacterium]
MPALEGSVLERAEDLAERILPSRTPKQRMLVIVNPYASTVSDRLKNLVVYALQARYEVEAIDTEAKSHATELCREAAHEGYDVVVAFGGDGTINEAANGLIGCETPLTCLPGGATNVFCRILGIPNDVVDATEHLLRIADDFRPRRVDTGTVNGRHFTFASGIGLDASVVERVDRHPTLKRRLNYWYFTWAALSTFNRRYLVNPPRIRVEAGGRVVEGVTAIIQTTDPFTYFGRRPLRICEPSEIDDGTFGLTVLKRASPLEMGLLPRIFSASSERMQRARQVEGFAAIDRATVTALGKPFPLQMDGDYVGDFESVEYGVARRSLLVVS